MCCCGGCLIMRSELEYSVAMTEEVRSALETFLLRTEGEEDLLFALYRPSRGAQRLTAMVTEVLYPLDGEREQHGNVSFHPDYLERAYNAAMQAQCGLVFLHSHVGPGWQGMSDDDVQAEVYLSAGAVALTGLPLFGMTVGTDGTWSARAWMNEDGVPARHWCTHVRSLAEQLRVDYAEHLRPAPRPHPRLKRTVAVWGKPVQAQMTRLTIGIVGLGSVGSQVCEQLARSGFTRLVLIDHDRVEEHNLDRLTGAYPENIGEFKVDVSARQTRRAHTADHIDVRAVPFSLNSQEGYGAALDCDVLISCVDRPQPRRLLDHLAYAHLIPVIDGGIRVLHRDGVFRTVNWQVQTVGPGRPCLECIGAYTSGDAELEASGLLDDPAYVEGLPKDALLKASENVFTFSAFLASMEVLQLVALATGLQHFGVQRYDFQAGTVESHLEESQGLQCQCKTLLVGDGDRQVNWLDYEQHLRELHPI